jgi:hypothetical protein
VIVFGSQVHLFNFTLAQALQVVAGWTAIGQSAAAGCAAGFFKTNPT